jgi:hypothetical protein
MSDSCPTCGNHGYAGAVPPEPPPGTWIKDRFGGTAVRIGDGWAPALHGFYPAARWDPMWNARGPLVECGPYGRDLDQSG